MDKSPAALAPLERIEGLKTDADAQAWVSKMKDTDEAIVWAVALRTCCNWHFVVGGITFSRYTKIDDKDEDEGEPVIARVKGALTVCNGAKLKKAIKMMPDFVSRWINRGVAKKEAGTIHYTKRSDYRRQPNDEPLGLSCSLCLIPFKMNRAAWPQPVVFNRGRWPVPMLTTQDLAAGRAPMIRIAPME